MEVKGPEGFKQMVTRVRTAFPNIHFTIEDIIAEGDKVVTRFTRRSTHTGEFMGIAPTGKKVTLSGILITRWLCGKEVEAWENLDTLAMFQQLGVSPPAGQT